MNILRREIQARPENEDQLRGFARRDAGVMTLNTQHEIKKPLAHLTECSREWTPTTAFKIRSVAKSLMKAADEIDYAEKESYSLAKLARDVWDE